jgi:ubiquinone/menaquinone biosynthesis C-methylase UbiE
MAPIPPTRVGDRVPPGRAYREELDAVVTDMRQVRRGASPYDTIAELYDPWSRSVTEDVAFYVAEALRAGGPVVELGIGTGRIAIPIAQKGIRVIGIDSSREMLAACRRRADDEGVAELLDLHLGDLRSPPLHEEVPLVICPFRSYLHLADDGERIDALTAARAALRPRGRLAFDVFAPKPDDIAATHGRWLEREPGIYELADWDESARTLTLAVRGPSGAATMALSWISREEWQHLLEEAGFTVEACYGWFDGTPFRGGEDMVFVASAA